MLLTSSLIISFVFLCHGRLAHPKNDALKIADCGSVYVGRELVFSSPRLNPDNKLI